MKYQILIYQIFHPLRKYAITDQNSFCAGNPGKLLAMLWMMMAHVEQEFNLLALGRFANDIVGK